MALEKLQQPVVNHIALYVSNLQISTTFYAEIMQFKSIPEPFKLGIHSWFQIAGNCQLHLIAGATENFKRNINNHLAFSVASFDVFVQNMRAAGIAFCNAFEEYDIIQTRPDGIRQIFFQDPDGYWLEVNDAITGNDAV